MWTQQWLIKLFVAHVSFVGDPVSVVQCNEHLFWHLVVMVSHVVWTCLLETQTSVTVEPRGVSVHERAQ